MFDTLKQMAALWIGILFVYIILGATMGVHTQLVGESVSLVASSANMSNPGNVWLTDVFHMWPILVWFIPGGVGIVASAILLRGPIERLRGR